jgi:sulfoxide reductase heme-binding subunit YedZ
LFLPFKGWLCPPWFKKNRCYFGVAEFAYALAQTAFYLIDIGTLNSILGDVPNLYIWTGWVAFIISLPLAVTSSDYFVRIMGPNWKQLQKWTYVATVLTLLHWASLHDWSRIGPALVRFLPLGLLEAYRA